MKEIVKFYDKTLKLYLEIEKELFSYFRLVKKIKFRSSFTLSEKEIYYSELLILRKKINNILKRLRKRLGIISIDKFL